MGDPGEVGQDLRAGCLAGEWITWAPNISRIWRRSAEVFSGMTQIIR
jgi:hypothetical protein